MADVYFCLTIIAVVAIAIGVTCIKKWVSNKNREKVIVTGRIIGFELDNVEKYGTYFFPVFEYCYNGQIYQGRGKLGTATIKKCKKVPMSKYKEGDEVEIAVFTDEPASGIINTPGNINLMLYAGVGTLLFGLLFATLLIGMLVV